MFKFLVLALTLQGCLPEVPLAMIYHTQGQNYDVHCAWHRYDEGDRKVCYLVPRR